MPAPLVSIDPANVQGIVAHTYTSSRCCHLFFRFSSAIGARAFLRTIPSVTSSAAGLATPQGPHVNVAFSFAGLEAMKGLSAEALSRFPSDFREGPSPERLHDSTVPWWNGVPVGDLHCLVSLHTPSETEIDGLKEEVLAAARMTGTMHLIVRSNCKTIDGQLLAPPRRVHFGYLDGFSGPTIAWKDPASDPDIDFRHFLLGYASDEIDSSPRDQGRPGDAEAVAFCRDGSYGAFRVMYQDVAAFNRCLAENASRLAARLGMTPADAAEWLAAKMLGRWQDGRPLVLAPQKNAPAVKPEDNFDYAQDGKGWLCPFSAHIRVSNPRDQRIDVAAAPVPRVLRRGMPYGHELVEKEDDGVDRGLIGLFLCANLREQFEKIMDWINRNDFSPVFSDLRAQDPLLGNRDLPLASTTFLIPASGGPFEMTGLTTFVRPRGTAYLLFPGMQAIRQLAGVA